MFLHQEIKRNFVILLRVCMEILMIKASCNQVGIKSFGLEFKNYAKALLCFPFQNNRLTLIRQLSLLSCNFDQVWAAQTKLATSNYKRSSQLFSPLIVYSQIKSHIGPSVSSGEFPDERVLTQPAFTCSKLTIETLQQGVKYVQS